MLNAYEFERHAGCKTKHPNNHIYFENGKTIYQIVQELRSTPESLLFDAIQTVFGAPINQKSFRIWKGSKNSYISNVALFSFLYKKCSWFSFSSTLPLFWGEGGCHILTVTLIFFFLPIIYFCFDSLFPLFF